MKAALKLAALVLVVTAGALIWLDKSARANLLPDWLPIVNPQPLAAIGEQRIAAHWRYGLALRPGRLYAWGGNSSEGFLLGPKRQGNFAAPLATETSDWRYISAGLAASYAITKDGRLLRRAMQPSSDGSMGAYRPVFAALRWIKVDEQNRTSMGLAADGTLKVWSEFHLDARKVCSEPGACYVVRPDGTLEGLSDAELDQQRAAERTAGEAAHEQRLRQVLDYWRAQPMGEADPRAQATLAELRGQYEAALSKELPARERLRTAYAARRGQAAVLAVPGQRLWSDFCLASDGGLRKFEANAIDDEGKAWRIGFDADEFRQALDMPLQGFTLTPIAATVSFNRVYCGAVSGSAMWLDEKRRLWKTTGDQIEPFTKRRWRAVASGSPYGVGITSSGALMAWGEAYFQAMPGSQTLDFSAPVLIDDTHDWQEIAGAGGYLLARDAEGRIYTWGSDQAAQDPYVSGLLADGGVAATRARPGEIVEAAP